VQLRCYSNRAHAQVEGSMTKRSVRGALLLLFLAAIGATGYLFWSAEREVASSLAASRAFDDRTADADARAADLRSAQQAYVAAGQGADFWFDKGSTALDGLKSALTAARADATAPDSASAFDDAFAILQDLEQMDTRARDYTRNRQIVLASDLIYSDGVELARRLTESVGRARGAERAARDTAVAALNRREAFALGAAAAASLAIVLLLLPSGGRHDWAETSILARPAADRSASPAGDLRLTMLDEEGWSPARPRTGTESAATPAARPAPAPAQKAAPAAAVKPIPAPAAAPTPAPPPVAPPEPRIDLGAVARICNDLARVGDTKSLPSLLERASGILDAAGIVVWVADPDARELAPIIVHGYPQHLVNRLGVIGRDAENATAAAFRTALLQTVKADSVSNGAIAAPLLTPAGCVGVMAAEVNKSGEQDAQIRAAAGIIAAQLATLIGPPSARQKAEAAG
jgi:hypothetical protein